MKSNLPILLKNAVAPRMQAVLPQFVPLHGRDKLTYVSNLMDQYYHFIQFQPESRPDRKRFTVNCAWSMENKWPESALYSIPFGTPQSEPKDLIPDKTYSFRIGFLFPPYRDYWWEVTPPRTLEDSIASILVPRLKADTIQLTVDQVEKLQLLADDAVSKCHQYVLEYFGRFTPKH